MKLCGKHVKGYMYPRRLLSKYHACEKCGAMAKWVIRLEEQSKTPEEMFGQHNKEEA